VRRETRRADSRTRAAAGGFCRGARYGAGVAGKIIEPPGRLAAPREMPVESFLAPGDPGWELRVPEGRAVIVPEEEPGGRSAFLLPGTGGTEPGRE